MARRATRAIHCLGATPVSRLGRHGVLSYRTRLIQCTYLGRSVLSTVLDFTSLTFRQADFLTMTDFIFISKGSRVISFESFVQFARPWSWTQRRAQTGRFGISKGCYPLDEFLDMGNRAKNVRSAGVSCSSTCKTGAVQRHWLCKQAALLCPHAQHVMRRRAGADAPCRR